MSDALQRPRAPVATKEHPVVQAGRDYWRPATELQLLRARIEALEVEVAFLKTDNALTIEALARSALTVAGAHEKRMAGIEAKLAEKDRRP